MDAHKFNGSHLAKDLRCKPGQMAFQIHSEAGNVGKIVKIIRLLGSEPFYGSGVWYEGGNDGPCWLVEHQRHTMNSHGEFSVLSPLPDAWMFPLDPEASEVNERTEATTEGK